MKKYIAVIVILLFVGLGLTIKFMPKTWERSIKTFKSEIVGLNRVVSVYAHEGKLLKTYKIKTDIKFDGDRVLFDYNDQRVVIVNAITIIEEVR